MCVIMAALVRASKSFEMTEPWLFKQNSGMQSQGRSRWNILSGTGAAGAFCVERGSYPKLLYLFSRNWSQSRSQFCLFRIHAQDATRVGLTTICWGPESEPPGYLAQPRSPSRSRYFPALLCRNMGRNYLKFLF